MMLRRLTEGSIRCETPGTVKLRMPPRQSRGISQDGLGLSRGPPSLLAADDFARGEREQAIGALTEQLFGELAENILGKKTIQYQGRRLISARPGRGSDSWTR